jgi:hypothetical protein
MCWLGQAKCGHWHYTKRSHNRTAGPHSVSEQTVVGSGLRATSCLPLVLITWRMKCRRSFWDIQGQHEAERQVWKHQTLVRNYWSEFSHERAEGLSGMQRALGRRHRRKLKPSFPLWYPVTVSVDSLILHDVALKMLMLFIGFHHRLPKADALYMRFNKIPHFWQRCAAVFSLSWT